MGTVTFLFTDIEGSTGLAAALGLGYAELIDLHHALMRSAFVTHGGLERGTQGDSFVVVFRDAPSAVRAAVEAQRALTSTEWPGGTDVRVRMGLHSGLAVAGGDDYSGLDINRAARIAGAGHGGQVLLSESTWALAARDLPAGVGVKEVGRHRLRGLAELERIVQLTIDGLRSEFPPLQSLSEPRTNLPRQITSFVGREPEVEAVAALLASARLVTLVGVGGTGKTRVMLQVAEFVAGRQEHGEWLVELAPISDPAAIEQEVARALGVPHQPGQILSETLVDFLRAKELLLLLDNCEHLIASVAAFAERLLVRCSELRIMATSREPLGLGGEAVYAVPSLRLPDAVDPRHPVDASGLHEIANGEAVRLFVERAQAVLPAFTLDVESVGPVVEICRRLDGIPLALELAAARTTVLSVGEIEARLGDRFRLLTGGRRTAIPRQQTLQAAIDWSWELLTEPDRALLQQLSVFAGGWALEAAAAVAGDEEVIDTLDRLARLADRSLVVVDHARSTRYRMLETIRQYAAAQLVASGDVETVRGRHLAYFHRFASDLARGLDGPEMLAWLERADGDVDNLRAALEWAFASDTEVAIDLSLSMATYWRTRSYVSLTEWMGQLTRAVELARALGPTTGSRFKGRPRAAVAELLAAGVEAHTGLGNVGTAQAWAEEAVAVARETEDDEALRAALSAFVLASTMSGRFVPVADALEEVRGRAERAGDSRALLYAETSGALVVLRTDPELAIRRLRSALGAAQRTGNPASIAFVGWMNARATADIAGIAEARPLFEDAIAAYRTVGDRRFVSIVRSDLAHALRRSGSLDQAEAIYRETLPEWLDLGNRGAIAHQLESLGYLAIERGDSERAARTLGAAEALREEADAPRSAVNGEDEEHAVAVRRLRQGTDGTLVDAAWSAGRRMTLHDAVVAALAAR